MDKKILIRIGSYLLVFFLGAGACYLWIAKKNPQIANIMTPSASKQEENNIASILKDQRSKIIKGSVSEVKGNEFQLKLSSVNNNEVKKIVLKPDYVISLKTAMTEKEKLGKYYEEFVNGRAKSKSGLPEKERVASMKKVVDLQMQAMKDRVSQVAQINQQILALGEDKIAEKEALRQQIKDIKATVKVEEVKADSIKVGDVVIVHLFDRNDLEKSEIKPERVEIIR